MSIRTRIHVLFAAMIFFAGAIPASAQVVVKARTLYTMAGAPGEAGNVIENGVVVITDGKIVAVGKAGEVELPQGHRVLEAAVATPGLIDARGTVGVSGMFNQRQDQDQLERSAPSQPELRAIDAYNPNDRLVEWVRSLGVTTIHTGHAPGELISGQTCVVKTDGRTVDDALVKEVACVTATLGPWAQRGEGKSPGTRAKMMSMLREELIKAREYLDTHAGKGPAEGAGDEEPKKNHASRDLRRETMARVLRGELPLLITANRAQDIHSALRLAKEFNIRVTLDSASESYLLLDEIKAAGVPVILHPTMFRMFGEMENMSFESASALRKAGIPVAIQSGYESYVPKTRVVLFEAAIAAANGLSFQEALACITSDAAKILGIEDRVGALKPGLDGDVALYDADPFEYTSHCVGVVINGRVASTITR